MDSASNSHIELMTVLERLDEFIREWPEFADEEAPVSGADLISSVDVFIRDIKPMVEKELNSKYELDPETSYYKDWK